MRTRTRAFRIILAAAVGCGICSPLISAQDLPDDTARIADGVYSYGPGGDYISMFVVTDEGVIAFESVSSEHSTGFLQAIQEVTDEPVRFLLHSHNHWDHASGGQVFKDAGATLVAHVEAYAWIEANTGPDQIVPDESWSGSRTDITLGATTVELHYLGMNHGLGMTVFVLRDERIAYIADLAVPNRVMFSVVPDFNIREWERSLEEILELDFDRAVFTHNMASEPLQGGTKEDVQANLQFIRDLRAAIYAEFQKGTNPMAVPGVVRLPQYEDWAGYDQWLEMNAWRLLLDDFMGPFPWRPERRVPGN